MSYEFNKIDSGVLGILVAHYRDVYVTALKSAPSMPHSALLDYSHKTAVNSVNKLTKFIEELITAEVAARQAITDGK